MIYLDHNATSPLRPEAHAAVLAAIAQAGNPSSVHRAGRAAREVVERARDSVAALAGVLPSEVVFTSGGTEACALGVVGLLAGARESGTPVERIVLSAVEHDAVVGAAERSGLLVEIAPVSVDGQIERAALDAALAKPGRALLAVMAVNNETGVLLEAAQAAAAARARGHVVFIDAVQAPGRMPTSVAALGSDALAVSAHKIGGPQGVGALIVRNDTAFGAARTAGGQERGRRPGTENVAGIAGFGAAADVVRATATDEIARLSRLRDGWERAVAAAVPNVVFIGRGASRAANTSCVALPGVPAETQVIALDLAGVCVSAGAACSSGKLRRSRVLSAMGYGPEIAECAVRVSLGFSTTDAEVEACVAAYAAFAARARPRWAA